MGAKVDRLAAEGAARVDKRLMLFDAHCDLCVGERFCVVVERLA